MADKSRLRRKLALMAVASSAIMLYASSASAYLGPGLGLSVIGTLIAIMAAIAAALFGFIWYPMKRIINKRKQIEEDGEEGQIKENER